MKDGAAMYLPEQFREDDLPTLHVLMRDYNFATLVTQHAGVPFASHLPLMLAASEDDMRAYIETELAKQEAGLVVRFVTVVKAVAQPVGSTSYLNIDRQHRRVEVGGTWITPAWQRSPINTEAKYLQLRHAFETLGCIRVEFKTDALNARSRQALARIGATEEGTFRNHMLMPGGRIRHSVYFSITHDEWPRVRAHLEGLLAAYPTTVAALPPPLLGEERGELPGASVQATVHCDSSGRGA